MTYGAAFLIFRKMGVAIKKDSYLLAAVSLLIGLSTCFTGNMAVGYYMNRLALILLFCIFILHQCHQDNKWNIGKYMASIILYLAQAVGMVFYPFRHLGEYILSLKDKRSRNVFRLLGGAVRLSRPSYSCACFCQGRIWYSGICCQLSFQSFSIRLPCSWWRSRPYSGHWPCTAWFAAPMGEASVTAWSMYAAFAGGSGQLHGHSRLCLSGILRHSDCVPFYGKGKPAPGNDIFQYARQGFFQLLFVAVLNLVMVLMCLKYFREHVLLNGFLLLVSLCTYVMLASAVYRMVLYVQQYQLTFLRILVLWFLAMLFVLMAGVVILIFNHEFPLFRFCLAVVSSFYLVFAWMRPDYITARYNVAHRDSIAGVEQSDFMRLSTDAAPAWREWRIPK